MITISIHALLAESDTSKADIKIPHFNFYPRSPCGERPSIRIIVFLERVFLSTLSLRRATFSPILMGFTGGLFLSTLSLRRATLNQIPPRHFHYHFYPRSPCGERRVWAFPVGSECLFLSTLSLRRATIMFTGILAHDTNFYPRSPCGERPTPEEAKRWNSTISIHALLAESDCQWRRSVKLFRQFLSTLSLRRATRVDFFFCVLYHYFYPRSPCGERLLTSVVNSTGTTDFYPRSPCGERHNGHETTLDRVSISIHALLAESDNRQPIFFGQAGEFLSTLSLRRATREGASIKPIFGISIHALLAESDLKKIFKELRK